MPGLRLLAVRHQTVAMDAHFLFDGHRHRGLWEIIVPLRGLTGLRLGKAEYALAPGQAFLIPASRFHLIWDATQVRDGRSAYYNLWFRGDSPLARRLCGRLHAIPRAQARFWEAGGIPVGGSAIGTGWSEERLASHLFGFLEALSRATPAAARAGETERAFDGLAVRMRRELGLLIDREPARLHRRSDLAAHFRLDPTWLSRKWSHAMGETLMASYFRLKIEQAKALLSAGRTVQSTADSCGFASPFHFSRKFKRLSGQSPSAWQGAKP